MSVGFSQAKNLPFNIFSMRAYLLNVLQAFSELGSLFTGYGPVNGDLNLVQGMLAALVDERRDIELLAGMLQNIGDDGTRGFPEHVRKHIIKFEIGDGEAVQGTVLFAGQHIGELHAVTHQVAELADFRRRDKARLDQVAHEEVTNPLGIFTVSLR